MIAFGNDFGGLANITSISQFNKQYTEAKDQDVIVLFFLIKSTTVITACLSFKVLTAPLGLLSKIYVFFGKGLLIPLTEIISCSKLTFPYGLTTVLPLTVTLPLSIIALAFLLEVNPRFDKAVCNRISFDFPLLSNFHPYFI